MRRIIILALLLGGMRLLTPLGGGGVGAHSLLTFGFLILAAYTTGELAVSVKLPRIVGYLLAGALFGPSVLNIVTEEATHELAPVSSLAIALIAFLAGAELRWTEVKERGATILRVLATELGLTFVLLVGTLVVLRDRVPFLANSNTAMLIAFSVVFASIAIVHSPAVTMALLTETKARGPVARTTLGVVLVSDVVVVLLFSLAVVAAQSVVPPSSADAPVVSLGSVAWEIGGAVLAGVLLGLAIALYLRLTQHDLALFALIVAFFGSEIARLAHTETLLTLLIAGFVAENVSRRDAGAALRHAMERSAAPVFVVFFALAGAHVALADVAAIWVIVLPIAAIRIVGIYSGSRLGARWAGLDPSTGNVIWMGLVSQAGVAIGLATVVASIYPTRGDQIRTLFLAVIAVNEAIGPILFRLALVRSGEVEGADGGPSRVPVAAAAGGSDGT